MTDRLDALTALFRAMLASHLVFARGPGREQAMAEGLIELIQERRYGDAALILAALACHPHGAPDIYVRVAPVGHGSPAWVLERVHGNPFVAGELALYAAPGQSLGPHRLGALPLVGRGFVLWPGESNHGAQKLQRVSLARPLLEVRGLHRFPQH